MLRSPRPGSVARIWYRAEVREAMPYHARVGTVLVAGKRRPRNHLVQLADGTQVAVPEGNLVLVSEA